MIRLFTLDLYVGDKACPETGSTLTEKNLLLREQILF